MEHAHDGSIKRMNQIERENLQYQNKQEKFDREELKRLGKISKDENHP